MRKLLGFMVMTLIVSALLIGCSNSDKSSNESDESNPFFFSDLDKREYVATALFDDIIERTVYVEIEEVKSNLDLEGRLYSITIEGLEELPIDRQHLGYFFVSKDKIVKYRYNEENRDIIENEASLPEDGIVVYQSEDIPDILSSETKGIHSYISASEDLIEYHFYNNEVESGYYEAFVWKKGVGLLTYKSGYGAERESINLKKNNKTK